MKNVAPRGGRGDLAVRHVATDMKARRNGNAARPVLAGATAAAATKAIVAPRKLQCFSVACHDMPQLEFGDKIVLPANVLLELQCFKVPTPMLFHIRAFGAQEHDGEAGFTQYCSVQEFSAPSGQVFIPYWMMQNLNITEGSDVVITNVVDIPRGIYCRLQPEDARFLDIAAEIGPKLLMESALRRYSVLSMNETILIDHGDSRFYVKVLELKPGHVVSLLGDVDLEMDFAAPPQSDPKRTKSATENANFKEQTLDDSLSQVPISEVAPTSRTPGSTMLQGPTEIGVGRRLLDGACVVASDPLVPLPPESIAKKSVKLGSSSFQTAKQRIGATGSTSGVATDRVAARADTDSLAKDIKLAQGAFTYEGHRLGGRAAIDVPSVEPPTPGHVPCVRQQGEESEKSPPNHTRQVCEMCLSEIAKTNAELHGMRCARHPSYHKFECSVCHEHVLKRDQPMHMHCTECKELLTSDAELTVHINAVHAATHACNDCGVLFTQADLEDHRKSSCPRALEVCKLCGFRLKRREMATHTTACASRTEKCEVCHKYIKIVDVDAHLIACVSDRESASTSSSKPIMTPSNNQLEEATSACSSLALECVYCAKSTFKDDRQLERHVNQECHVARSFRAAASCTKPMSNDPAATTPVKTLIQGKLRRREDAVLLNKSALGVSFDTSLLRDRTGNQHDTPQAATLPLRDALVRERFSDGLLTSHAAINAKRKLKPVRPPAQVASLPTKPTQPHVSPMEMESAGLVITNTSLRARASASTQLQLLRQQPVGAARVIGATRRLQAINRP